MEQKQKGPVRSRGYGAHRLEQLPGRLKNQVTSDHFGSQAYTISKEASIGMLACGAAFATPLSDDFFEPRLTYEVAAGGDRERCRAILADTRHRLMPFSAAFRAAVLDHARGRA